MKCVHRTRVFVGALVLAILPTPVLAQHELVQPVSFKGKQGRLMVIMDGKRYQLTSGQGNWDWLPVLSPKGSFVAFLRQPKDQPKVVRLCLMRLKDGKTMTLRTGKYGVHVRPYKTLALHWRDSNTLLLTQGKLSSLFDLRGRKLDSKPMAERPERAVPNVNFHDLAQQVLAQRNSN